MQSYWGAQHIGCTGTGVHGILKCTMYWGAEGAGDTVLGYNVLECTGNRVHGVLGCIGTIVHGILGCTTNWGAEGAGCTMYWGAQGAGFIGVHNILGCRGTAAQSIGVHHVLGCTGTRVRGILFIGVHRDPGAPRGALWDWLFSINTHFWVKKRVFLCLKSL